MAHDAELKREARRKYIYDRQTLAAIAVLLGVPETTLRRWKRESGARGDSWDAGRSANTIAGEGLEQLVSEVVQDYVVLHQAAIEDLRNDGSLSAADKARVLASLADSFNKTVSAAGRVSPKISELGVAMDVLKRLADFVVQHRPDLAPALLEVIEPFGATLTEVYG